MGTKLETAETAPSRPTKRSLFSTLPFAFPSRHGSLYAKGKMFSAINWKGKKKEDLLALVRK